MRGVELTRTAVADTRSGIRLRDVLVRWRWQLLSLPLALLAVAPLLVLLQSWLQPENQVWEHLAQTVLADLVWNTLVLLIGVAVGVLMVGVGLAWLTATCEFPGRRVLDWALMLPLAIPGYVLAFVLIALLDFSGPLQLWLRDWFGPGGYWFPTFRSTGGVIITLVLVLYPYVYMLARSAFLTQGSGTLDAARVLGLGPWGAFFRVALPMARPAIVAGASLAMMETLADFGTVAVFNYDTFTTAIYKAWFGLFNIQAAAQLASLLLLVTVLALAAERRLRGRARFHETGRIVAPRRTHLRGVRRWLASAAGWAVLGIAFVLPMGQLLAWAWDVLRNDLDHRYFDLLFNTLVLGVLAASLTLVGAMLLAFAKRYGGDRFTDTSVRAATLGYALPGSVLAVGVMLVLTAGDDLLREGMATIGMTYSGQLLTGGLLALLFAYLVRFMAVAFGPVDSGLERIRGSLVEAARNLGAAPRELFSRIYLPLLRPGLLTALLLVLVDVMKEMPATLLLRPFGWDTLAVRIYELTSEGEWERAALPAVTLVLAGLLPVVLLVRRSVGRQT